MRHSWIWLLLVVALSFGMAVLAPVSAQAQQATSTATIDYEAWEEVAERAERVIEAGDGSTAVFQNQRTTLVEWRGRFLEAQSSNNARIETLQAQLDALGPAPVEGETEPDTISQRRSTLNSQLAEAQVPRVRAVEAFNRADGLVAEIDAVLDERQTTALLELDPSPLNPVNWRTTATALITLTEVNWQDIRSNVTNDQVMANAKEASGGVFIAFTVGLLLLIFGRGLVGRGAAWLVSGHLKAGNIALSYFVSLGQVLLPVAGVALILYSLILTQLTGDTVETILSGVMALVVIFFFSLWIAGRLFPDHGNQPSAFDAPLEVHAKGRRLITWIGLFLGLATLVEAIAALDMVPPAARGVLLLPAYVGLCLGYWRLARFVLRATNQSDPSENLSLSGRLTVIVVRAVQVVAILGPLLAAVGYLNAATELITPMALTLGVLAVFLSLQPVIHDLYALLFRTSAEAASDALTPVLINFLLVFAAVPVLALIWGVRPERLGEVYSRFLEGFSLGGAQITPVTIVAVLLVFAIGYLVTRLLQTALRSTVLPRTKMDTGARNAVTSGVGYIGIALAAIIAITAGGIDLTALGFVLGALSVGIGFGLQNVVSNFVSGIILLIERPISEGDWIEVNGNMGIVKDISVRSTRIETFDKTDLIVPNADFISGTVTNWTRGNSIGRAIVTVGVAYGNDTRRVEEILMEIAHNHPVIATFPEPGVDFLGFGADSLDFRIRAILRDVNQLIKVKTELYHQIAERFTEEGIEIPFAQRDIWLRNPEVLHMQPSHKTDQEPGV